MPNLSKFAVQNAVRTWQKHMNNNLKMQGEVPQNDVHPNLIKSCLTTWLNVRKRDSAHFCTFNLTHCTMNYVTVSIFNPKFWQFMNQIIQWYKFVIIELCWQDFSHYWPSIYLPPVDICDVIHLLGEKYVHIPLIFPVQPNYLVLSA